MYKRQVRMWAMYQYGGIYMDTDIQVLKRFDEFLNYRFFTAMEYHGDNAVSYTHLTLRLLS